jgi:hypothetical protein
MPRFPRVQVATVPPPPKGATSATPPPDAVPVSLGPPYYPRRASTPGLPTPPSVAQLTALPLPLHAARPPEPRVKHLHASNGQACLAAAVGPHAGRVTAVPVGREPLCAWAAAPGQ